MKRIIALLLVAVCIFGLCACSGFAKLDGKYYSDDIDGVYYEFDGDDTCYLTVPGAGKVEYRYVVNEDEENGTYVIHISDTNSSSGHKLIYDSNQDSVYDFEIGNFSKK